MWPNVPSKVGNTSHKPPLSNLTCSIFQESQRPVLFCSVTIVTVNGWSSKRFRILKTIATGLFGRSRTYNLRSSNCGVHIFCIEDCPSHWMQVFANSTTKRYSNLNNISFLTLRLDTVFNEWIRTIDLVLNRDVLYPTELHCQLVCVATPHPEPNS